MSSCGHLSMMVVAVLPGDLLAIENFAYTAHALDLPEHSSLGEFGAAARAFCSRPFPQTLQQHSKKPEQQRFLWRYCFGSAFAWTLLHDVLQLGEGQMLHFTNTLHTGATGQEVGLDWALGAAVLLLSKSGGSEGALLRQQRLVVQFVLLAAVTATAALLVVAGVAASWWWASANTRKAGQEKRIASHGNGVLGIPNAMNESLCMQQASMRTELRLSAQTSANSYCDRQ